MNRRRCPPRARCPAWANRSVYRIDRYWVNSSGRRNTSPEGVAMTTGRRRSEPTRGRERRSVGEHPPRRSTRFYNRLTQPVLRRPVELALPPAVAVMDERLRTGARAIVERWFQRIKGQLASQRTRHTPAHDPAGEDVDHERDVREAPPRRHV